MLYGFGKSGTEPTRMNWLLVSNVPAQLFGGEIPKGQRAIRCSGYQVCRVGGERTDPHRTTARMLQHGLDLARGGGPNHCGRIGRARGQELSAGAEATAVDAVSVS